MFKKDLLEDTLNSIKRLNTELDERIAFEHKLMDIIAEKDILIKKIQDECDRKIEEIKEKCLYVEDEDDEAKSFIKETVKKDSIMGRISEEQEFKNLEERLQVASANIEVNKDLFSNKE